MDGKLIGWMSDWIGWMMGRWMDSWTADQMGGWMDRHGWTNGETAGWREG